MHYRTLGASGLRVSPICLGTMTFGSPVGKSDAVKLMHAAMDMGINFIDTANVYEGYDRVMGTTPGGVAEEIVGKGLKGRRSQAIVATKLGSPMGPDPQDVTLAPSVIIREVEASLKRLQTDYIDLYIMHWPDPFTPLEYSLSAMETLVRQGKVRNVGMSNHWAFDLAEMLALADKHGWPRIVSSQIPYSLLRREFHKDLLWCEKHNVAVTPYQALQGGLLTGKYKRDEAPPKNSRAADKPQWVWERTDALYDTLEAVEALAAQCGVPTSQYAMAWTLAQPAMASLVIGVTRIEQIEDAVAAIEVDLSPEILCKQDGVCPQPWSNAPPFTRP